VTEAMIEVIRGHDAKNAVEAQIDLDFTRSLMTQMQSNSGAHAQLRVYAPVPTVAFSRRESLLPTYAAATAAARAHGFEPVIRLAGGRAVAYDSNCLVVDLITPTDRDAGIQQVFDVAAESIRRVLADLGVDARVGEVAGEFCAGAHSINARGVVKLVGIAQRVTRGARLVTASIALDNAGALSAVINDVYGAMNLPWKPETFGTLAAEGISRSLSDCAAAITTGLSVTHTLWATETAQTP
jgi:octanoyl-[GcvH]:protein N-octanoyltransferase